MTLSPAPSFSICWSLQPCLHQDFFSHAFQILQWRFDFTPSSTRSLRVSKGSPLVYFVMESVSHPHLIVNSSISHHFFLWHNTSHFKHCDQQCINSRPEQHQYNPGSKTSVGCRITNFEFHRPWNYTSSSSLSSWLREVLSVWQIRLVPRVDPFITGSDWEIWDCMTTQHWIAPQISASKRAAI